MENNRHLEKVTFKLCCDHASYQYQASIDRIYFLIDLITSSNMPFVKLNVILFNFDDRTMFQIKEKYGPEIFILATNIDRKVNLIFLLKKPNQQTHFILCKSQSGSVHPSNIFDKEGTLLEIPDNINMTKRSLKLQIAQGSCVTISGIHCSSLEPRTITYDFGKRCLTSIKNY